VCSLPFSYCMLFIHRFSCLSLMRKRKYSFRLIQIRFVTSKTSNSVDQYSHEHMSILICVFQQLALAKTNSHTKKRKDKVHPSRTRKPDFLIALYWPTPFSWKKKRKMPTQTHTNDNSQANICLCGRLAKVKWICVPHNVRKENSNEY